jgi:hypothetical protein
MSAKQEPSITKKVILSYSFKIILVISLFLAAWKRDWIWVIGTIIGILLSITPTLLKHDIKITLPWPIDLMIACITVLHVGGRLLNAYTTIPWYLEFTHLLISALIAFLAFAVIYILDEYWEGLMMDKYAMAFLVVIFTMAVGVLMEFGKWIVDYLFGPPIYRVWSLNTTMTNLLLTTISGIIVAVIGVNLMKSGSFEEMTDEFGEQVDSVIIHRKKE